MSEPKPHIFDPLARIEDLPLDVAIELVERRLAAALFAREGGRAEELEHRLAELRERVEQQEQR